MFILFYELFILSLLFIIIKSSIKVYAVFSSIDEHILYCDDYLNFYGTSNLNVYKISENENLININSQLKMKQVTPKNIYCCKKNIYYSTSSNNEKLLIELYNIKNLYGLFRNSTAVSIEIKSDNYDDYEINIGNMFGFCSNLISIDLSNFSFKTVKYIYSFFEDCRNLEKVIWPNNKEKPLVEWVYNMFTRCLKLTSIHFLIFLKSHLCIIFFIIVTV